MKSTKNSTRTLTVLALLIAMSIVFSLSLIHICASGLMLTHRSKSVTIIGRKTAHQA